MIPTLHHLIENYGLYAVFLGCMAEGESVAVLGGFFAHQNLFSFRDAILVAFVGAFIGDTLFFMIGHFFTDSPYVHKIRAQPGFSHAFALVRKHPNLFVLTNRYIYGLRLVGGIASGMAGIPVWRFVVLNAVSSAVWAGLFCSLGYFFGLGVEAALGRALHDHHRIVIGLVTGVVVALAGWALAHHFKRRSAAPDPEQ